MRFVHTALFIVVIVVLVGAASPSACAKSYPILWFDRDSFDIAPDAMHVVRWVGTNPALTESCKIEVRGYADRFESEVDDLSRRRAEAVRDALIAMKVPAEKISTAWYGSGLPYVADSGSFSEPLNRRVSLTILENRHESCQKGGR